MPIRTAIDAKIKEEIIKGVRDEGMRVNEASIKYRVSAKTIYRWLNDRVVDGHTSLILENNRLKKELEQAYSLLGRATAEMKRPKR